MFTEQSGRINTRELAPGVRGIEIDRPTKRGALTTTLMREMIFQLETAESDPGTRAIVLSSIGPVFCAGADLNDLSNEAPDDDPGARILEILAHMSTPVVAAVQGATVGMGATMLLHCDVVHATENSSLHMPFLHLGFTPEGGATVILPAVLGPARAKRVLLLGEPLTAAESVDTGLWTELVPAESLLDRAVESATTLAQLPADAVKMTKELLRPAGFADSFRHESLAFSHQRMKKLLSI